MIKTFDESNLKITALVRDAHLLKKRLIKKT